MKKNSKETIQKEAKKTKSTPFPLKKENKQSVKDLLKNDQIIEELHSVNDCRECDNVICKCKQVMTKLSECVELTDQLKHAELYNILLTITDVLANLEDPKESVQKILKTCEQVYRDVHPKEMGRTLN